MAQGCPQALRWRLLEVTQHPVHATRVNTGMPFGYPVSALPTLFVMDEPAALLGRE